MNRNYGQNRRLFRQFSAIRGYEGWVIGKLHFCRHREKAARETGCIGWPDEACVVKKRQNYAILQAEDAGCLATMFLIKPGQREALVKADRRAAGEQIAAHTFSVSEILGFVEDVQDENPIHRTGNPMVPGLQMIEWFWSIPEWGDWKVCVCTLRAPAYAGQELQVYRSADTYECLAAGTSQVLWQVHLEMETERACAVLDNGAVY